MPDLQYSADALNTLALFHRSKYVVYVEGEDDRPFWNEIFRLCGLKNFHLKVAGNKTEIEKYAQIILRDGVDIVVARDCDYSDLLGQQHSHKQIIYTYGYSIENSLYCVSSIAKAIAIYSKSTKEQSQEVDSWLESFVSGFDDLLVYDIANELHGKGVEVMGDKCVRFLTSNSSFSVDSSRVQSKIEDIKSYFTDNEVSEAKKLIEKSSKSTLFLIRGHFLTNGVINFIKNKAKLRNMSLDMLYGQMIALFPQLCVDGEDIMYLKERVAYLTN